MRVMVVGPLGADDFADNVSDTLTRMGHEVNAIGAARRPLSVRRANSLVEVLSDHTSEIDRLRQLRLIREVRRWRPELLLTMDRRVHREVVQEASFVGARSALWFPDSVSTMGRHDMFINGYDRIYLKNPVLTDILASIYGIPTRYLPEACNSSWHRSTAEYGTEAKIVMAGNVHPTRAVLLKRLVAAGVPLELYGAGVPEWVNAPELEQLHSHQYLYRQQKADTFRRARIVLNNLHPAEYAGVNCRLFEAAGSGALVLTESRAGLEDLLVPGQEVETFASYGELKEKIEWYMKSSDNGRMIADQAASRAHRDHEYENRLEYILADLL